MRLERRLAIRLVALLGLIVGTFLDSWFFVGAFAIAVAVFTALDLLKARVPEYAKCAKIDDPTYYMQEVFEDDHLVVKATGYYPYTCPAHGFSTLSYEDALEHVMAQSK